VSSTFPSVGGSSWYTFDIARVDLAEPRRMPNRNKFAAAKTHQPDDRIITRFSSREEEADERARRER